MEESLITFETAKLAKEKGFNIPVWFTWIVSPQGDALWNDFEEGQFGQITIKENHNEYIFRQSAPTQSLLQKWLREVHKIIVFVAPLIPECNEFGVTIYSNKYTSEKDLAFYKNYEEALEVGLQEALKLIK